MGAVKQHSKWGLKVTVRGTFLHAEMDSEIEGNEVRGREISFPVRRASSLPACRRIRDSQPVVFVYSPDAGVVGGSGVGGAHCGCGAWRAPDTLPKTTGPMEVGAVRGAASSGCGADRSWQSGDSATTASGGTPATPGSDGTPVMGKLGSGGRDAKQEELSRTTVMMRNVPTRYSRRLMLDLITAEGLIREVDFLYVPVDFRTEAITGFAFVNLATPEAAQLFRTHFHGFSDWGVRSGRVCNVSWARDDQQGLEANVERFRNSSLMHPTVPHEHKPLILNHGAPVVFPSPTKFLTPPRQCSGAQRHMSGKRPAK